MTPPERCDFTGWIALLLVFAVLTPGGAMAQTSGCRPADTVVVPEHLAYFKDLSSQSRQRVRAP
jgi:hypothetical protein